MLRGKISKLSGWPLALILLLLCGSGLWLTAQTLLPSLYLAYSSPWSEHIRGDALPAWNSLLWDGVAQYYPWRAYAAKTISQGELPLWNPYQFCGVPFLANGQSALLYPLNLLFWFLPLQKAFGLSALLHLYLAGIFTYLYLRRLGLSAAPSVWGGVGFALNGFFASWVHLPTLLNAAIWLPFLLWVCENAINSQKAWKWILIGALGVAFCLFAGHIQTSFYVLFAFIVYSLLRIMFHVKHFSNRLLWLVPSVIIGLLLAASQLLPSSELAEFSHRGTTKSMESYRTYLSFALPVPQLSMLFLPHSWGDSLQGTYFGKGTFPEYCSYLGLPVILLAFCSSPRRHGLFWWIAAGGSAFALAGALGWWNNALFFFLIPGFERTGGPARILILWHFFMNVLSALGLANMLALWQENPQIAGKRLLYALGGMIAAIALVIYPYENLLLSRGVNVAKALSLDIRSLAILAAICGVSLAGWLIGQRSRGGILFPAVLGVLLLADLGTFWSRSVIFSPAKVAYPPTDLTTFLQKKSGSARIMPLSQSWSLIEPPSSVLPPNSAMVYRLMDVQGYDSLFIGRYKGMLGEFLGVDPSPPANGNMILLRHFSPALGQFLGVKYVLCKEELEAEGLRKVANLSGVRVYEYVNPAPRTGFTKETLSLTGEKEALRKVLGIWGDPFLNEASVAEGWFPLTVLSPPFSSRIRPEPLLPGEEVEIESTSPNGVSLRVTCLEEPRFLVLRDVYYPGWECYVDGSQTLVERADFLFRGVRVLKGRHQVEFVYRPASFKVGFYFSCVAILALAGLSAATWMKRRETRGSEISEV